MSKIEVDAIDKQSGSTLTLGGSGTAVTLASGATQTGFGRTGTVDWQTSIKTNSDSPLTVANGKGYFLNTTSGTITVNLPAGSVGDIVAFKDYAKTWDTNNVTIVPNGSDKIGGVAGSSVLNTENQSVTLIFTDSTRGWLDIHDSSANVEGAQFITATGGTITTVCTNFKVHTFTGPGTFTVCTAGNAAGSNTVDYLVIAGGGAGGGGANPCAVSGGGGGAGGYRESGGTASGSYTVSTAGSSPAPVAALPVSAQGYPIVVGGGGPLGSPPASVGGQGSNSSFSTIVSTGGGGGGYTNPSGMNAGSTGGSGGSAANGNTPAVTPPQGNNGGANAPATCQSMYGGGGGAIAVGVAGSTPGLKAGNGGAGGVSSINGTPTARGGGGGGGVSGGGPSAPSYTVGSGGAGGGGEGKIACGSPGTSSTGGINLGGGGGGGGDAGSNGGAGAGGSGIVIIRYKFQ